MLTTRHTPASCSFSVSILRCQGCLFADGTIPYGSDYYYYYSTFLVLTHRHYYSSTTTSLSGSARVILSNTTDYLLQINDVLGCWISVPHLAYSYSVAVLRTHHRWDGGPIAAGQRKRVTRPCAIADSDGSAGLVTCRLRRCLPACGVSSVMCLLVHVAVNVNPWTDVSRILPGHTAAVTWPRLQTRHTHPLTYTLTHSHTRIPTYPHTHRTDRESSNSAHRTCLLSTGQ